MSDITTMDNFFITQYLDWKVRRNSNVDRALNLLAAKLGLHYRFQTAQFADRLVSSLTNRSTAPTHSGASTSVEQRMNLYHFASQVIAYGVKGDFVELGCIDGGTALMMQKLVQTLDPTKSVHLYDPFNEIRLPLIVEGPPLLDERPSSLEEVIKHNFAWHNLQPPVIHKGALKDIRPEELPRTIAFAHLDGDFYEPILESLRSIYDRLSKGAICLINDYCDPAIDPGGWNYLPGVKQACDEFMSDKPEHVTYIYAGPYSHGFFRKL